ALARLCRGGRGREARHRALLPGAPAAEPVLRLRPSRDAGDAHAPADAPARARRVASAVAARPPAESRVVPRGRRAARRGRLAGERCASAIRRVLARAEPRVVPRGAGLPTARLAAAYGADRILSLRSRRARRGALRACCA